MQEPQPQHQKYAQLPLAEEKADGQVEPMGANKTEGHQRSNNHHPQMHEQLGSSGVIDPSLFEITGAEREIALMIKEAIEDVPDLDPLSDFMYVQLAIAGEGEVDWAVERAYKMQQVRQEYKIPLTYGDGKRALQKMTELKPGWFMSFSCNPHTGKVTQAMDLCLPVDDLARDPRKVEAIYRGCYYMCYANFPSFECIREGSTHIMECMGYDWGKGMMKSKHLSNVTNITHDAFPSVLETKWYHTPSMANVLCSMTKRYISEDIGSKWQVGCQFDGGRLDKYYMQPTPEIATERLLQNWYASLWLRLESERVFKL